MRKCLFVIFLFFAISSFFDDNTSPVIASYRIWVCFWIDAFGSRWDSIANSDVVSTEQLQEIGKGQTVDVTYKSGKKLQTSTYYKDAEGNNAEIVNGKFNKYGYPILKGYLRYVNRKGIIVNFGYFITLCALSFGVYIFFHVKYAEIIKDLLGILGR